MLTLRTASACPPAERRTSFGFSVLRAAIERETGNSELALLAVAPLYVGHGGPTLRTDQAPAISSIRSNRSTSINPWSVSFSDPITDSGRNDSAMNGRRSAGASVWAAACRV
jgi:hypothetical protein